MKAIQRKHAVPAALCAALLTLTVSGCAQESIATTDETLADTSETAQEEVVVTDSESVDETTADDDTAAAEDATRNETGTEAASEEASKETTNSAAAAANDAADAADEAASDKASTSQPTYAEPTSNDTAVIGEYTPYDQAAEAAVTGGVGIEGSEEEQLQQERIAGGAVGAVVSKNLEPLVGITDYSEGEFVPVYGISITPPAVAHDDANGDACSTCHMSDTPVATAVPHSHLNQNLTDEDCVTCHSL